MLFRGYPNTNRKRSSPEPNPISVEHRCGRWLHLQALVIRASVTRPFRQLSAVPHRHDPNRFSRAPIEEPIRPDNDFPMRQVRKLRYRPTRFWKFLEATKNSSRFLPELPSGSRTVLSYILQAFKKLSSSRRCKLHLQDSPPSRIASASLKTLARVCPSPTAISFSPVANRCKRSRSCSDFS